MPWELQGNSKKRGVRRKHPERGEGRTSKKKNTSRKKAGEQRTKKSEIGGLARGLRIINKTSMILEKRRRSRENGVDEARARLANDGK